MKHFKWQIVLGAGLVVLAVVLSEMHYLLFRDAYHLWYYLLMDVAFIPVEVLVVTLIIDRVMAAREKKSMMEKLNMAIGMFYSEAGTHLLHTFIKYDPAVDSIRQELVITQNWSARDFAAIAAKVANYPYAVRSSRESLVELKDFLTGKREFMLRLLENPNLLEHETFTELLWAVFHLNEELALRTDLTRLAEADRHHLAGDVTRAYRLVVAEWVNYMGHLSRAYPYLFSLAMRTNPFDNAAKIEVVG
jgi:hypothetical protein